MAFGIGHLRILINPKISNYRLAYIIHDIRTNNQMKFTITAAAFASVALALEGHLYQWDISRMPMTRSEAHDYCWENFGGWLAVMDAENIDDALDTLAASGLGAVMIAGEVGKKKRKNCMLVPGEDTYPVVKNARSNDSLHVLCQSYLPKRSTKSSKKSSSSKRSPRRRHNRKHSSSSESNSSESEEKRPSRF